MNKIWFPTTNRVQKKKQKKLLDFLGENCITDEIKIETQGDAGEPEMDLDYRAAQVYFTASKRIREINPDIILVRGDRYEMAVIALVAKYLGKTVAHIEGGDWSGSIDNIIRHTITQLADIHFPTNEPAEKYLFQIKSGDSNKIYCFGSLDCEFAMDVPKKRLYSDPYILVLHHEIKGEEGSYKKVIEAVKEIGLKHVSVKSNNDFVNANGTNEFSPENFINLLWGAECLVGNSSSGIKEASVLGTPVVDIRNRQKGRFKTMNVAHCNYFDLKETIEDQLKVGFTKYPFQDFYYKPDTAKNMSNILLNI